MTRPTRGWTPRCAEVAGPLLDHDSTAYTARDMNLLREAADARMLNYYGTSYGTLLGPVYANLFPATTGRMILGNINSVAWSTGNSRVAAYFSRAQGRRAGTVMTAFSNLCGKVPAKACAFSAGPPGETTAE